MPKRQEPSSPATVPPGQAIHRGRGWLFVAGGLFLLGLLVRLPAMSQSLWYDELYTLIHYIARPWEQIIAGQYSPNNHVLFNLLAKLITPVTRDVGEMAMAMRLPSLLAGAAVGLVLAWPIRHERPCQAVLIGAIAALHPWLVSFSTWARGYALVLFLCALGTALLPNRKRAVEWRYALVVVAALYTQPIAITVVAGHGLAMILLRRQLLLTWLRSAAVGGLVSFCLYLPFLGGAGHYWSVPERPSISYREFLGQILRYVQAGDNVPGTAYVVVPLLLLVWGAFFAWRQASLRPALITFSVASVLGVVFPLVMPAAGEVRAMLWLIPLYCICAAAMLTGQVGSRYERLASAGGALLLLVALCVGSAGIIRTPAQPIAEAVDLAHQYAQEGTSVIGVYMGSAEARTVYGGLDAVAYRLEADARPQSMPALKQAEAASAKPPIAVVFYESFLRRDEPELWGYLRLNYTLVQRLPGRISPVAIYRFKSGAGNR